jgi:hypothetical protein
MGSGVFAAWNPKGGKDVLQPGVKVLFFGSATSCDSKLPVGPVATDPRYLARELSKDTGLSADDPLEAGLRSPAADSTHCKTAGDKVRPGSFVITGLPGRGGVGLFTTVGPDAAGRHPLVDTWDSKGQGGAGANAGINGSFVAFRFPWESAPPGKLWSVEAAPDARAAAALDIQTTQTVAVVSLGTPPASASVVKQAKQQLTITFINPDCRHAVTGSGSLCQIQYLFTLGVVRSGVSDWSKVDWWQTARLWIDPAQGNMPVVDGPIWAKGRATRDVTQRFELYTSAGEETAHDVFKNRAFKIRLGFDQFQNALRIATATLIHKTADAVSPTEIAQAFGAKWNDPASWTLLDVEVGQEVYDPNADSEADIGGSFREITIGAAATARR